MPPVTIYTIGHSNHTTDTFLNLLQQQGIDVVVDVRSQPYSQWTHQFNRETLRQDLKDVDIEYRFMGRTLGGRPDDRRCTIRAGNAPTTNGW